MKGDIFMKYISKILIVVLLSCLFCGGEFSADVVLSTYDTEDATISLEELERGYSYSNKHTEAVNLLNIEILDTEVIDAKSYAVCGRISGSGLMYYPYVAYYENNQLKFQKTFSDYGRGVFNDLIFEDDKIILFGYYENSDVCLIALFEMNLEGNVTKNVTFGADKDSYGYKVLSLQYEYMIVGATYASSFCGCTNSGTKSMVVGRVSKEDFDDNYIVSFGNESMDFHDAVSDGEAIFILATVNGLGYFSDRGRTKFLVLIKMDHYVDSPEYISLYGSEVVKTSKMFIYQDHVCFMEVEHSHQVGLVSYSKDLEFINMDIYTDHYLPNSISDFMVATFNDNFILSLYSKSNNKLYERRIIFDKDFEEIFNEEYLHKVDDSIKKYKFNNNVFFYVIKGGGYELYTDFYVKKSGDNIYINGRKCEVVKTTTDDSSNFGTKKEYYEAHLEGITVKYYKMIDVELETNIVPFSTYDTGLTLSFNARGLLNGEEVSSGYQVNDCGQYLLELFSTDGKKESIYFTVGKLTIDPSGVTVIEEEQGAINSYEKIYDEVFEKEQKIKVPNDVTVVKANYNYNYLIISCILGVLLGLLLCKGKRKKNV